MGKSEKIVAWCLVGLLGLVIFLAIDNENQRMNRCDKAFSLSKNATDSLLVIRANPICGQRLK